MGGTGAEGDRTDAHQAASPRNVILSVTFFCWASLSAIFINKACLTHFQFSYPFFLMLLQSVFTFLSLSLVATFLPSRFSYSHLSRRDLRRLIVPTVLFIANVSVGLSALTLVNIPMFSAFRRITVLFVMCAEYVYLRRVQSRRVILAVVILSMGAFVSAVGDVTFSTLGYVLVFANNILTASYLASIKRVMADLSISPLTLLYYMAILSFGPVLLLSFISGDFQGAFQAYSEREELSSSHYFVPALVFVAGSALCVNLATSVCTHVTSPLTTSVAGQLKNVLQTILGFFSWGYVPTPLNVVGLLVALGGQIAFGTFKYLESIEKGSPNADSSVRAHGSPKIRSPSRENLLLSCHSGGMEKPLLLHALEPALESEKKT